MSKTKTKMLIWKPVYILLEKWRFEFFCKWFGVQVIFKSLDPLTDFYETGIRMAWWPVKHKLEGCSRFQYHWQDIVRTSREAFEDGNPIRTTP